MLILRNIERRCENILDDTMYSDSILEMMASTWLLIIMMFLVLFTLPIWIVPYLIIKMVLKHKEARDGE